MKLKEKIIVTVFFSLIISAFVWMFLDTKYQITNQTIYYNSGFIKGTITINRIRKIEYYDSYYVPVLWKIALNKKGLIIYYDKFEDIFFSPENEEKFVATLIELNPNIELKNSRK